MKKHELGLHMLALFFAAGTASSCSGDGASPPADSGTHDRGPGAPDPDSSTDCSLRTELDMYTANMKKAGGNGLLSFHLVEGKPAPPVIGMNSWTVKVTRTDGTVVSGGLTAEADMPDHGHNVPIQPHAIFDAPTGNYTVAPVYFSMPGRWRIRFRVTGASANDIIDFAEFNFCIS